MTLTPLKRAIFESGRTQRSIADQVPMSESAFSRIVNGLHTDELTQHKIAAALGLPVEAVFPSQDAHNHTGAAA